MSDTPPGSMPPPPGDGTPPPSGGSTSPPPSAGGSPPPGGGGGYGVGGGRLAEWQDRAVSGLIDFAAPFLFGWVLQIIGGGINPFAGDFGGLYFVGALLQLAAVGWGLYNGHLAGSTGQSTGMKQSGLRLVGADSGGLIGSSQGLVRNLLLIPGMLCCAPLLLIDNLWPLWDAKKQTLRDKIGKSVVVKA